MVSKTAEPEPLRMIEFEGKPYEVVKEGLAEILNLKGSKAVTEPGKEGGASNQNVFYNPIQQFNRDLSVLAIKTFAEDHAVIRKQKHEKKGAKSLKRKRDADGVFDGDPSNLERRSGPSRNGTTDGEAINSNGNSKNVEEATRGQDVTELNSNVLGDTPKEPMAERSNGEPPKQAPFRVLDALSATGLRALRYSKEIPEVTYVTANDLSAAATQTIALNVRHNGVADKVFPRTGNALSHMYRVASDNKVKPGEGHNGKYEVIDLDPYGTAAPFLDAAVQSLNDGGLLCVTCTDAGVFASLGYLEKTFSQYGGLPFKGPQAHEAGLRLILHAIATVAAKHGIAIEPLLSLSIDFYVRVFVKIRRQPNEVKLLAGKTMIVYNCGTGCGSWTTQPIARTQAKVDKIGTNTNYKFTPAQAPTTSSLCENCCFKTHLAGPMWGGPLHNPYFIQRILDHLPSLDPKVYHTIPRIEGMLTTAMHETLLPLEPSSQIPAANNSDPITPASLPPTPIPRLAPASHDPHPFFIIPSVLSKVLHCVAPSDAQFRGALLHLGYRATRSHTKPGSIKTDAPWRVIWEIMREWVRQKSPVKEGAVREGMAGWRISRNASGGKKDRQMVLREELRKLVEEGAGGGYEKLKMEVEAVLSRAEKWSAEEGDGAESGENENAAMVEGVLAEGKMELNVGRLKIVFDEKLGKEPEVSRKLVRYQINPRANWGPMNRAKGDP